MNSKSVFRLLAFILLFVALLMAIPTALSYHYGETESLRAFLMTLAIMAGTSVVTIVATMGGEVVITARGSYLFVTLSWVLFSFFGCLPLYFSKVMPSFASCFFEIMSGFTTTGATALDNIEAVDKSILFWRNMTNWLGGMGVVVLFVAVLPAFGAKGTALMGAESVGPTKDKLTPHIRHTAIALWAIYFGLSLVQTVLLLLGGLDLFNAVTLAFGTMGAAGYTPTNASIASYSSVYVEWVCIIFMFLAGINFALYFRLIRKQFSKVVKDGELRLYATIVLAATLMIALNLITQAGMRTGEALRHSAFQTISFVTTTGFSSTSYQNWPVFSQTILLALSFVGGCAGSAAGGPKVIRIAALLKLGLSTIQKRLHPKAVTSLKVGQDRFSEDVLNGIAGFFGMYIMTFAMGCIVISLTGQDILTVFSSCILTLGNIGIGHGGIGTEFTFSIFPDWSLWVFSFLMLAGRLELFTVYALFTKSFWRD